MKVQTSVCKKLCEYGEPVDFGSGAVWLCCCAYEYDVMDWEREIREGHDVPRYCDRIHLHQEYDDGQY